MADIHLIPDGVWPTMITPFKDDQHKSIDWEGLDSLTEWFIQSGVSGLFSVCLSSEMFQLTNEERLAVARRVVNKAAGRVPVVAGATFEGTLEDQAKLMNEMGKIATAVVIITNQIAGMEESDDVWIANAQRLLDLTGDIPVGTYETPVPRVRSLTIKILNWAAGTNRFVFHKDTSLDCNTMLEKLETIKRTKIKFFTAKIQFLKTLLDNGGNGFSGVTPNFHPWMVVWMCNADIEDKERREEMHEFLSITDRVLAHKYPTSAKVYLKEFYGLPLAPVSRIIDAKLNDQDIISLRCMKSYMEKLAKQMQVEPVDPTKVNYCKNNN